ncbi:MAG: hypothetical protein AAGJ31_00490, partial [Verrucomicrobiota bacterium]
MRRLLLVTILFSFLSGCRYQEENPAAHQLAPDEEQIIEDLLLSYSLGKHEDCPQALSSRIGARPPASRSDGLLDYNQYISMTYLEGLLEVEPEWLLFDLDPIPANLIGEALDSMYLQNLHSVDVEKIGAAPTVPSRRLCRDLKRFDTGQPDDFWRRFDQTYPDNAGYAQVSRVGFSGDRSVAVVYYEFTAGGT